MIKVDVSNVIPKRLGTYLLAIIPGLIFGLSVAFGDPSLARAVLDRAKQIYPFQPYALLILFLASCLLIGHIFFLLSWFADVFLGWVYRFKLYFIFATLGSDWLYRTFSKMQGIPPKRNIFVGSLSRIVMWGRKKKFLFEVRPVLQCQRIAATQLLARKYRINPSEGFSERIELEWQVWLAMLGKQPAVFRSAFVTMRMFLACGLAALGALYIVPALQNRYFIFITIVLLASACFQSFEVARWMYEPVKSSLNRLAWILAELSDCDVKNSTVAGETKEPILLITDDAQGDSSPGF